ncbi:hypothetical protein, partial [Mycolicibacterium sp. P1-5]|uniref:hypothetical protein n=1 Tax=Mycolicibacterium sp. P1-5 TaxID=2024617 RepID=UPI001D1358F4
PRPNEAEFESEQSETKQKTPNKLASKNHTPTRGYQSMAKNNNKQKPPNTLLSSQTTRPR